METYKLQRGNFVEFRYLDGSNVRIVAGWVDEIKSNSIKVGNECISEREGMIIKHTKKYLSTKIEKLESKSLS